MLGHLKRLVTTGTAYQFGDIISKGFALLTLPLYTHHVSEADYGAASSLLTGVILLSIFLRGGVGEAFIRFYFDDDDYARRDRIARTATATVAWTTTIASLVALVFAGSLSRLILGFHDPLLIDSAIVGLWAFTNLELAYAQLRVDERTRAYICASGANVVLTVGFTISLVVFAGQGARGLLLGNFGASAVVVVGLWWVLRHRFSLRVHWGYLRKMLCFGMPTVPADASLYALQVVDRFYLFRHNSQSAAGLYAVGVQLASIVLVAVRGFQYAWPPLAYSIKTDEEAGRLYALVATYYTLVTGSTVCGVALSARWMVRLLAAPQFLNAYLALPWLALGWSLYGLYLLLVVIAGRRKLTSRNLLAAAAGLGVNIVLLRLLVPTNGAGLGVVGAGVALCSAYAVMLVVIYQLTRSMVRIDFEWPRLVGIAAILVAVVVSGEVLLPTHGIGGLGLRLIWLGWIPVLLVLTRFFHPQEAHAAYALIAAGRKRVTRFRGWGF